jgi:excisionase family DNA binding protein
VPEELYSVEQVAQLLDLHVRTVRGYVRDSRLKAIRIGKQYRISRADLERFTGGAVPAPRDGSAGRARRVEVSTVVQVDAISAADAGRLSTLLTASAGGRDRSERALRIQTIYDEEAADMKVLVFGGLADSAEVLRLIGVIAEPES